MGGRTNGDKDSDQREEGDVRDTGQSDTGNGEGGMQGGAPIEDDGEDDG